MRYALFARFAAINIGAAALVVSLWREGLVAPLVDDPISQAIVAVFAVGWPLCAWRIWKASRLLNEAKEGDGPRLQQYRLAINQVGVDRATKALEYRIFGRVTVVGFFCSVLVMMGFMGTVYGFRLTLGAIDGVALEGIDGVIKAISGLLEGMYIAIDTTLVGSFCWLVLKACEQVLFTGLASVAAALLDSKNKHAAP